MRKFDGLEVYIEPEGNKKSSMLSSDCQCNDGLKSLDNQRAAQKEAYRKNCLPLTLFRSRLALIFCTERWWFENKPRTTSFLGGMIPIFAI